MDGINLQTFLNLSQPHRVYGSFTITKNNLVTTTADGLVVQNRTAATLLAPVQVSPDIRWHGSAWKSDAVAASHTLDARVYLLPATGAAAITGSLVWQMSINGGAYSDVMRLSSAGTLSAWGSLQFQTDTTVGATTTAVYRAATNDLALNVPTGSSHTFAINGVNVAYISAAANQFFRLLRPDLTGTLANGDRPGFYMAGWTQTISSAVTTSTMGNSDWITYTAASAQTVTDAIGWQFSPPKPGANVAFTRAAAVYIINAQAPTGTYGVVSGIILEGQVQAATLATGIYFRSASTNADLYFLQAAKIVFFAGGTIVGNSTTATDLAITNSTLTSGQMLNLTLSGTSVVATTSGAGSIASFVSTATAFSGATHRLVAITSSGANTTDSVVVTGLAISVTNTRTASANTNIALTLTASGAGTNTALQILSGNITSVMSGTGTTHYDVNINTMTNGVGQFFHGNSITAGNVLYVQVTGSSVLATRSNEGSLLFLQSTTTGMAAQTNNMAAIVSSGANTTNGVTVNGLLISVTNTNATSGTNIALTLTASGATGTNTNIALKVTSGVIDISGISAGSPNFIVTATSDTPSTTYTAHVASTDPAGYVEIVVGGDARYIPFFS